MPQKRTTFNVMQTQGINNIKFLHNALYFDITRNDHSYLFSFKFDDIEDLRISQELSTLVTRIIVQPDSFEFFRVITTDEDSDEYLYEIMQNKKFTLTEYDKNNEIKNVLEIYGRYQTYMNTYFYSQQLDGKPAYVATAGYNFYATKLIDISSFD